MKTDICGSALQRLGWRSTNLVGESGPKDVLSTALRRLLETALQANATSRMIWFWSIFPWRGRRHRGIAARTSATWCPFIPPKPTILWSLCVRSQRVQAVTTSVTPHVGLEATWLYSLQLGLLLKYGCGLGLTAVRFPSRIGTQANQTVAGKERCT